MRVSALIPVIFGLAAFILSILCIFAGSKPGFMEDYAIVTLNTSRIGSSFFNTTTSSSSSSSSSNIFHSFISNLSSSIESDLNDHISSLAQDLGLHDFYSVHLLDYCKGYYMYTPPSTPNTTTNPSAISQNTTFCSNKTAFYHFNPTQTLQNELDRTGLDITLQDLNWPEDVEKAFSTLRVVQKATFLLYCMACALLLIAVTCSLLSVFLTGGILVLGNVGIWTLAFLTVLLASGLVTGVAVKASDAVDEYGGRVGVRAQRGDKFLVISWVATGLTFLGLVAWCVECVLGRRRERGVSRKFG